MILRQKKCQNSVASESSIVMSACVSALRETKRIKAAGMHFYRRFFANTRDQICSPVAHFLFRSLLPGCVPSGMKPMSDHTSCIKPFGVSWTPVDSEWAPFLGPALCLPSLGSSPPIIPVIPENPNYFLSPLTLCSFPCLCSICATFSFKSDFWTRRRLQLNHLLGAWPWQVT